MNEVDVFFLLKIMGDFSSQCHVSFSRGVYRRDPVWLSPCHMAITSLEFCGAILGLHIAHPGLLGIKHPTSME